MNCDRCGGRDELAWFTDCATCGPVMLCFKCRFVHIYEIAEEEEYEYRSRNA